MDIKKHCIVATIVMGLCASGHGTEVPAKPKPGLSVQNGVLTLQEKPFHGMGANYFSLFSRTLEDPSDTSYQTGLKRLSEAGIPFVRFMACAFWPAEWDLYLEDKTAYFRRLDNVVRCAEQNRIGLIPSLFWHMATVPDIVGEPMDQYGNTDSRTVAFVRQYTREMVLRYRGSPAVWAWEFGNEYNLAVDLPNASQHRPPVVPRLKTALHRTARDELSSEAMLTAYGEFALTVRQYDQHRVLITGNAIPRPSAYHNTLEKSWTRDSAEQFEAILLRDNPNPFDTLCVHVYAKAKPDYPGGARDLADLIRSVQTVSARSKRPLFVGEFGAPRTLGEDAERSRFKALVKAIEVNRVPLSAFWVYDYPRQEDDWNVTWDNDRQYMLSLVSQANQRMTASVPNLDTFNYILGTQTIGAKYQFTNDTRLVETAKAILEMIDWLNIRQQAVDDAKRDTAHHAVQVYAYVEVNRVRDAMLHDRKRIVNRVLPHTRIDYVSYSAYDMQRLSTAEVHATLDYVESKLPQKDTITGKRVFIGEFGIPAEAVGFDGQAHEKENREALLKFVQWGCPFVLYWEMYCNEIKEGKHRGFWLIDDQNIKQPLYHWLEAYFQRSRQFVNEFKQTHGHTPARAVFSAHALKHIKKTPGTGDQ